MEELASCPRVGYLPPSFVVAWGAAFLLAGLPMSPVSTEVFPTCVMASNAAAPQALVKHFPSGRTGFEMALA